MDLDLELLVCTACGTQFGETGSSQRQSCEICDDPRQFIPPSGQSFTTLGQLREDKYTNKWKQDAVDDRVWSLWTEPKFGIGQRALFLKTAKGNVLWDLIAYLDGTTIERIKSLGGLHAIVISHPHFYTTHVAWARTFQCPVWTSIEDREWLNRQDVRDVDRRFVEGHTQEILEGITAVKTGGHFDGSLVLHWEDKMFIADSLMTVPSALYHVNRLPGTTSYSFMWSIPNMIPLPPDKIAQIWRALCPFRFTATFGNMLGADVRDPEIKKRILESAKIQIKAEGHHEHELMEEVCP